MALRSKVFTMYGTECWLCGTDGADTIDHIIPFINGGGDDLDNLRPAHGRKSKNCVGNFSRKRPKGASDVPAAISINGITYGDGWIEKVRGHHTQTIFYRFAGIAIDDPFITSWIANG